MTWADPCLACYAITLNSYFYSYFSLVCRQQDPRFSKFFSELLLSDYLVCLRFYSFKYELPRKSCQRDQNPFVTISINLMTSKFTRSLAKSLDFRHIKCVRWYLKISFYPACYPNSCLLFQRVEINKLCIIVCDSQHILMSSISGW